MGSKRQQHANNRARREFVCGTLVLGAAAAAGCSGVGEAGSSGAARIMDGDMSAGALSAGLGVATPVRTPTPDTPPTPPGEPIATFAVIGPTGAVAAPFAFGHAFRQGDVPPGLVARANIPAWQCSPLSHWPDGSLKHAIVAGLVDLDANQPRSITLSAGSAPSGPALSEAQLAAALPAVQIAVGSHVTLLSRLVGTSARHMTVCAGPVMSNWIYREPVAESAHLVVWIDVRLYQGGAVEIFPWIENAQLLTPGPTNAVKACSVTIAGSTLFSRTIDIKHRTRVPLLEGTEFAYWHAASPGVVPRHDVGYLTATRLVPNYGWRNPTAAALDALPQSYMPNTLAGVNPAMGTAGSSAAILPRSAAMYLTSGADARAYRATLCHALSSGSWSIHYRDETSREPIRFGDYPRASLNVPDTPVIPAGTGGTNGNEAVSHLPSYGYFAFLITGRWWFWEECAFWTTRCYLGANTAQRFHEAAVFNTSNGAFANRGAAWALRTLAETLALCPSDHSTFAQWKAAWENNTAFYRATYVDGTAFRTQAASSAWVSTQGFLGEYASNGSSLYPPPAPTTAFYGAAWMQAFSVQVWGHTSNLGLPQSTVSVQNHLVVRNHAYKQPVSRGGAGSGYNWRRFIVYGYPIGRDSTGLPVDAWFTSAQSYSEMLSGFALTEIPATPGATLKAHSSDTDLNGGSSSASFGSQQLSSLAFAVEHGAPGAAQLWAALTGASNFAASFVGLKDAPEHAIAPR